MFISYSHQCGAVVPSSSQAPGPEVLMEGAERSPNVMLSRRPDETAVCRHLGLISDDELGVRAERKTRKKPLETLESWPQGM